MRISDNGSTCAYYFLYFTCPLFLIFHQNKALKKLWKLLFTSTKMICSLSTYLIFLFYLSCPIRDFSKHFFLPLFCGKNSILVECKDSLFHLFHFHNSHFIEIVEVLFLIHYPLEKHLKKGYIFSAFYSASAFSSNLAGFKSQNFYSL